LRVPFGPLTEGELRPLSSDSLTSAEDGGLTTDDKDSRGDLESLVEFLGLVRPLLDIIADVENKVHCHVYTCHGNIAGIPPDPCLKLSW
jgi:hypothetical protein